MGSWANTLFVRAKDAKSVVEEIETLLLARGYSLNTAPAKSQVRPGWMARLDEDFAQDLFAQHKTSGSEQPGADNQRAAGGSIGVARRGAAFESNGDADGADDFLGNGFDDEFDEDLDIDSDDDDLDDNFGDDNLYGDFQSKEVGDRNVCIFEPRAGWVAVMDSSLEGNIELAPELSARLSTDTMLVLVNDSDSWNYLMYRNGVEFDQFDAANGDFDGDGDEPTGEWLAAMENDDEEKLHELLMANAPQNIKFPSPDIGIPFQIATLGAKIASGQATIWERLKYRWLSIKFLFKLLTGRFSDDKMDFGYDVPHTPMDEETVAGHIERIQAFFPHATEQELRQLLPKCRFPSEDLLKKFLKITGLPWFYAYLSYDYLSEHSEKELASHGIVQVAELRFDPPSSAA